MPPKPKKTGSKSAAKKAKQPKVDQNAQIKRLIQQLQQHYALTSAVCHNLPLIPKDHYSRIATTFCRALFQHNAEYGELETGIALGYINPHPPAHPFAYRRDFMLNEQGRIGGFPSWLIPSALPNTTCQHCQKQMVFLLQLSAPIPEPDLEQERDETAAAAASDQLTCAQRAFHRQLYLFFCPDASCLVINNSVKVFRAQLPRHNGFYGENPSSFSPQQFQQFPFVLPPEASNITDTVVSTTTTTTTNTSPVCILCGQMATICDAQYGPNDTTPIYCCQEHASLNQNVFHIAFQSAQAAQNAIAQQSLESTVVLPRCGIAVDFEVLDDGYLTQITEAEAQEEIYFARQEEEEQQQQVESEPVDKPNDNVEPESQPKTATTSTEISPDDEEEEDQEEPTTTTTTATTTTTTTTILDDDTTLKQRLSTLRDADLLQKLREYDADENTKSPEEKMADLASFVPNLEETDNIVQIDHEFQMFTQRMKNALPPLDSMAEFCQEQAQRGEEQLKSLPNYFRQPTASYRVISQMDFSKQILRYYPFEYRTAHADSAPLWAHQTCRLDTDATQLKQTQLTCPHCQAPRVLEMQLMPFLATYLSFIIPKQRSLQFQHNSKLDALLQQFDTSPLRQQLQDNAVCDFGTIAIYTCSKSCHTSSQQDQEYVEEFAYIQPST